MKNDFYSRIEFSEHKETQTETAEDIKFILGAFCVAGFFFATVWLASLIFTAFNIQL